MSMIFNKRMKTIGGLLSVCMVLTLSQFNTALWADPITTAQAKPAAAGSDHVLIIDAEGNVWAYGNNRYGQIGDGTLTAKDRPTKIYNAAWSGKAVSVAAGLQQSLMLLENGTVLQWGFSNLSEPVQKPVPLQEKAVAIAAGQDICMAILESQTAVLWSGGMPLRAIRHPMGGTMPNVREIVVGSNDYILLRDSLGRVYQVNTTDYRSTFFIYRETSSTSIFGNVLESSEASSAGDSSASGSESEPDSSEPESEPESSQSEASPTPTLTPVPQDVLLTSVAALAAGENFAAALLKNGDVYTWGNPARGALGYQTSNVVQKARKVNLSETVRQISIGQRHTIVRTEDGKWIGWGDAADLLRLDQEKRGIILPPSRLDLNFGTVNFFDCGDALNIARTEQGEYYVWGDRKAPAKLDLTEYLLRVPEPFIGTSMVAKDAITINWDPREYFTELADGFMITFSRPDGTEGRTQLLPVSESKITIRGLQFATNYSIVLSIHGKTGYIESLKPIVVQTLREDESAIESQISLPDSTPTPIASLTDETSADLSGTSGSDINGNTPAPIIGIVLIIIALMILFAAIFAIVFVWRRMEREDKPRFKAKRIDMTDLPAEEFHEETYTEDADYREDYPLDADEISDESVELPEGTPSDMNTDPDPDPDPNPNSDLDSDADDFLTREPEKLEYDPDDEDDDFIVRKP